MRMMVFAAGLLAAGCVSTPMSVEPAAGWRPVDATTGRLTSLADLQQLAAAFPDSASVQRRLLSAAARDKEAATTRRALGRLEAMGYALRAETLTALAPLIGPDEAPAAAIRADRLRQPRCASSLAVPVAAEHRLVEGVARDPRSGRLYLSSIVGRVLLAGSNGSLAQAAVPDAGSLSGLALDEPRRTLWVASGTFDPTPQPEAAFAGLIAFDLDRQQVIRRIAAPAGVRTLSDIALGPDGSVYASDPLGGGLYRLAPGAAAIEVLVAPGTLRSPQGIAVDARRGRLYVSDYGYGLAIVDLASGSVGRLSAAAPVMLDGIDGLYLHQGALIAIQNGTTPMRIARLLLSRDGNQVVGTEVVEAAHPQWGEPTNGHITADQLLYIADPQWERFGDGGALQGDGPLRPNAVRRVSLRAGAPSAGCPG